MIILVRHAQSEGNKNREIHQTTPDHRVKLTPEGHRQAQEAGRRLRDLLRPDDTLHFFTSPYCRARQTAEGMLDSLTSDSPSPSPFPRHTIKVYEEPRLREQDFGNFQPCSTEMERMWMERADYGHFFYRIPNGESAADAYDRVSGFNESLWRLFGEEDMASVCVLVTHGLMTRVFLMKWYHWSVEYFEDLRNINHCEFVIMTHNPDNGKYTLQNKLRTWSELKKDRDVEKERERMAKGLDAAPKSPIDRIPIRRTWGGCPDGCTHGLTGDAKRSLRARTVDSVRHGSGVGQKSVDETAHNTLPDQPSPLKHASISESLDGTCQFPNTSASQTISITSKPRLTPEDEEAARERAIHDSSSDTQSSTYPRRPNLHGMHRDSGDHLHSSAVSSSTTCVKLALLHLGGRDGGGSMSGANSLAPSDDEGDDHNHHTSRSSIKPPSVSRLVSPSQDLEDDGDDELSAKDTKRSRGHHHIHHHHHHHPVYTHTHYRNSSSTSQPPHRMANVLGDGDDMSSGSGTLTPDLPEIHSDNQQEENTFLEAQQREDQSIRGSVY